MPEVTPRAAEEQLDGFHAALELAFRWIARLPDGRDDDTATCAYVPGHVYDRIREALGE